jgi:hypothetical protein
MKIGNENIYHFLFGKLKSVGPKPQEHFFSIYRFGIKTAFLIFFGKENHGF